MKYPLWKINISSLLCIFFFIQTNVCSQTNIKFLGIFNQDSININLPNHDLNEIHNAVIKSLYKTSPGGTANIAYSKNGKFKMVKYRQPSKIKNDKYHSMKVTGQLFDKNGYKYWEGEVDKYIFISNLGYSFAMGNLDYGNKINLYNIKSNKPYWENYIDSRMCEFSDNGKYFVSGGGELSLFTAEGKLLWKKEFHPTFLRIARISASGSYVITNNKPLGDNIESGEFVTLFKKDGFYKVIKIEGHLIRELAFPYDGEKYFVVATMNQIYVYESISAKLISQFEFPIENTATDIHTLDISEKNEVILIGSKLYPAVDKPFNIKLDQFICLLNLKCEKIAQYDFDEEQMLYSAISTNTKYVVSRSKVRENDKLYIFQIDL